MLIQFYVGEGNFTVRRVALIAAIIAVCVVLSSCSSAEDYFGFKTDVFTVVEEKDTHGGFHGDGSYYLVLDCSDKREEATELIRDWTPLPLSENLQLMMYGGEKDGVNYGYNLAEEAHWPIINNGVYKFIDRQIRAGDKSDDSYLLDRYSFNFSVAVYDLDTDTLYYFEYDT